MFITKSSSYSLFGLWILSISPVLAGDTYRPGDEFEDCGQCPVMVVIPSGSFSMGGPPVDQGRPYSEGELRPVLISEPFAVGKFEITYQQWEACVIDEQCPTAKRDDWSEDNHPVAHAGLFDAQQRRGEGCGRLPQRRYRLYRLQEADHRRDQR